MGFSVNDRHPGAAMVDCYAKYFDFQETKLNGLINNLAKSNMEIKVLSDVMNKMAHAKQKDKKADFSNDEMMKRYIVHIHKNNPTIFDGLIHGFPEYIPDEEKMDGEMSLDEMMDHNLRNVDMSRITLDVFNEEMIDVVTQGIDGQLKMHSADLNQFLMNINNAYDEKSTMSENARRVIDQARDLMKSINDKMSRR